MIFSCRLRLICLRPHPAVRSGRCGPPARHTALFCPWKIEYLFETTP